MLGMPQSFAEADRKRSMFDAFELLHAAGRIHRPTLLAWMPIASSSVSYSMVDDRREGLVLGAEAIRPSRRSWAPRNIARPVENDSREHDLPVPSLIAIASSKWPTAARSLDRQLMTRIADLHLGESRRQRSR